MKRFFTLALLTCLFAPAAEAHGQALSHAYGRPLREWMQLYWTWALAGGDDQVGPVRFMPIPRGTDVGGSGTYDDPKIFVGEISVTYRADQAFMLPVAVAIGETYDPDLGIPDDAPLDRAVFTRSPAFVELNNRRLLDVRNLRDFYARPTYFDPPLLYEEPTDYGAVGALFVQGLGFVHPPLPVGTHRMRLYSEVRDAGLDIGAVFYNEWTITVEP